MPIFLVAKHPFSGRLQSFRASDSLGIRKPCVVATSVAALAAAAGEVVAVVAWNRGNPRKMEGKIMENKQKRFDIPSGNLT